ncbi:hypothetical protein ACOZEM_19520 [Streptomyces cellulosae]
MADTERVRETPHELALLAGGPRAAVVVAVVALHLRGAVEPGSRGRLVALDNEAGHALPPLPTPDEDLDGPAAAASAGPGVAVAAGAEGAAAGVGGTEGTADRPVTPASASTSGRTW